VRKDVESYLVNEISNFPTHWNPHQKLEFIKLALRSKILEIRQRNKSAILIDKMKEELDTLMNDHDSTVQSERIRELQVSIQEYQTMEEEKLRIRAGVKARVVKWVRT